MWKLRHLTRSCSSYFLNNRWGNTLFSLLSNLKRLKSPDSSLFRWKGVRFRLSGFNRSHGLTWGNRGDYSSFITPIISFIPSLNPAMNISRSEIEDMSVKLSMSLSNSSFCSSERDSLNKSSFLSASVFSFWYSGAAEMLIS